MTAMLCDRRLGALYPLALSWGFRRSGDLLQDESEASDEQAVKDEHGSAKGKKA